MANNKKPLPLYTKTGDKGLSNIISGDRLPKNHLVFEALGTVDELNANLGLAISALSGKWLKPTPAFDSSFRQELKNELQQIQHHLLTCGAVLAGSTKTKIKKSDLKFLEQKIDFYQTHTRTDWYTRFLLPGGIEVAARVDMARTICRRTERVVVSLSQLTDLEQFKIVDLATLIAFLNRLSDYLFSLRCFLNSLAGYRETEFVVD